MFQIRKTDFFFLSSKYQKKEAWNRGCLSVAGPSLVALLFAFFFCWKPD